MFGLADTAAGRRGMVERLERRARRGGEAVGDDPIAGRDGCTLQPFAARLVLGKPAFWRANAEIGPRGAQANEVASLSIERSAADAWYKASGAVAERGTGSGGMNRADLSRLKGSDPRKVALVELLWKQTTVSQEWLAERLKMRSAANVSQLLWRAKGHHGKVPGRLGSFVAGAMRGRAEGDSVKICTLTPKCLTSKSIILDCGIVDSSASRFPCAVRPRSTSRASSFPPATAGR